MDCRNRCARVNVKVLIILIVVVVALGISLVAARQIRRSYLSKRDHEAGTAAYDRQDWLTAYRHLEEYLGRNPDDVEILKKYAQARMSIRPIEVGHITAALGAYRRVLQLDPLDEVVYEQLARLYGNIGNFEERAYIARKWLEHAPNDPKALLWLAEAQVQLGKTDEARQTLEQLVGEAATSPETLPEGRAERVRAYAMMSQIILEDDLPNSLRDALDYLNKAVANAPESADALATRAQFFGSAAERYRSDVQIELLSLAGEADASNMSPETAQDRLRELATDDLELADSKETNDPRILRFLADQWITHGQFERAAAILKVAETLPLESVEEHFLDLADWTVAKFLLASRLALKRGTAVEDIARADDALVSLSEKRHRGAVLPSAIGLYVAAGQASEARGYLDEYVELLYSQGKQNESKRTLAYLKALVARVENDPQAVIDILQPVVVTESSRSELWQLLAEAYSQTGQAQEAADAYARAPSGDPQVAVRLAREYSKLGDWSKVLETAQRAEAQGVVDINLTLLRIEASVRVAAAPAQGLDETKLEALSDELQDLREQHFDRVDIRMLQAMIAAYLEQPEQAEKELKLAIEECAEPLGAEMQLARHYYQTKRMPEAIAVSQAACDRRPEVAEPWLLLSSLYAADADHDAARHCLRQGIEAVNEAQDERLLSVELALLELSDGQRSEGIALLRGQAAQDPNEIQARELLLDTREVQRDQAAAQKLVDELKAIEGESGFRWRLHQARVWMRPADWRSKQLDIASLLQACIDSDPRWSEPVLFLAEMYERLNELARAENLYRQALIRNRTALDVADKLATLLEKQGRLAEAERVLRQVEADPRAASAWEITTALRTGDSSGAMDELKLRISNDDRDAGSRILLARLIYRETKDAGQALRYLDEAEEIAPRSLVSTRARMSILSAEGREDEAQGILDTYARDSGDFNAYLTRAVHRAREGDLKGAEADYRKLTTFQEDADKHITGYLLLSNFYVIQERVDDAVKALEEGINARPDDAEARLQRRLIRILLGRDQGQDRERALKMLAALEARMPHDPELLVLRARLLLSEVRPQSHQEAKAKLEEAITLKPTAVDAHLALADIEMQEGRYEAARDAAVRGLGSNPDDLTLLSAQGGAELALGNARKAAELALSVIESDPNNAVGRNVFMAAAVKTRDHALLGEARKRVEAALARTPEDRQLLLSHARVMAALGQPQAAIPALEACAQRSEGDGTVEVLVALADSYRLSGNVEQAGRWIDKAEQVAPKRQTVIHARLVWLATQKRFAELAGISSAYLSAEEENPAIVMQAARILAASGSMELKREAVKLFEHATELAPGLLEVRLGLASTLYQTGNVERAETTYRELLEEHPNHPQILNDLAWIIQESSHRYEEALSLADKGLTVAPENVNLLDTRGTILANIPDRFTDAKSDFARLVALADAGTRTKARALFKLGCLCATLNETAEVKRHLEAALEIDRKIGALTPEERSQAEGILR